MQIITGRRRAPWVALALAFVAIAAGAPLAAAQPGAKSPRLPGLFQPVVGAGTVYEMVSTQAPRSTMTYAIVGKEELEGKEAWWIELRFDTGDEGETIMKQLALLPPEGLPEPRRMIMQSGDSPPIEMPPEMVASIARQIRSQADDEGLGEKIGTEKITVPAGTFTCDHYRKVGPDWKADIWFSRDVRPNGLVRMISSDAEMTLVKVLSNETSRIKGTPQRMPGMPGGLPPGIAPAPPPQGRR